MMKKVIALFLLLFAVLLAERGHARAQNNLGFLYQEGSGVPQDYTRAVKWYRPVAEQTSTFDICSRIQRGSRMQREGVIQCSSDSSQ